MANAISKALTLHKRSYTVLGIDSTIELCRTKKCNSPVYKRYEKNIADFKDIDEIEYAAKIFGATEFDAAECFSNYVENENDILQLTKLYMNIKLYVLLYT
jgi:hypothetical protein